MSAVLDLLVVATACTHVLLAPFTKVEESFNLHATHDVLMYGVGPDSLLKYDHFVFSGAVPRSFIGSVLLAWLSTPVITAAQYFGFMKSKLDLQIIVRLVLASSNALIICLIRRAVSRRFGRPTAFAFALLTCVQFHLPFWMGRTLPNMFALAPVNFASYLLLNCEKNTVRLHRHKLGAAIALLTFSAVVLRAEVTLLLGPIALQVLWNRQITFVRLVKLGLLSGLSSIALTVLVDSYFWNRWPVWPELAGIHFNIFQGKSADWGVSPFHVYFTSHLPKILLGAGPLALVGFALDHRIRTLLGPAIVFVALISALGHKEWRFIVYVVPLFNVAAARGAHWLIGRPKSRIIGRLAFVTVAGLFGLTTMATILHTRASMANYPGGAALAQLNDGFANVQHVHVHIANLAAQSGASLFLQTHAPPFYPISSSYNLAAGWTYNKTEHVAAAALTSDRRITHVLAEDRVPFVSSGRWVVVGTIQAFKGWEVQRDVRGLMRQRGVRGVLDVLAMRTEEVLWLLERTI